MPTSNLTELLETVLDTLDSIRRTTPFGAGTNAHLLFRQVKERLATAGTVTSYPGLRVRGSLGQGNWATIPWIALLDRRVTGTTQEGVYVVYLFRADLSGVYLTLNQGVTRLRQRLGVPGARKALEQKANELRPFASTLTERGFALDHEIDLGASRGIGAAYRSSTVAHKLYLPGKVPSEAELLADLQATLDCYRRYADSVGRQEPHTETRTPLTPPPPVVKPATTPNTVERICSSFSTALTESQIRFGEQHDAVVRSFLASLLAKRLVILSGLSGSGKTQIALRLGEWFGPTQHLLVPVRPDWTGPESLLGFEDALAPIEGARRPWFVPAALEFILRAAASPRLPHLLILDEMNLAHVERYFADVLAGIEAGTGCIPNLAKDASGRWRVRESGAALIPFPRNLFIAGTVNVDETTYMFSPKVLDRANTLEFRVATEDLLDDPRAPLAVAAGDRQLLESFVAIAANAEWQREHPAPGHTAFVENLRRVHALLSEAGFEFGHRLFFEAQRFAAILAAGGQSEWEEALDLQLLQKVLPRLHGSRRRLEPVLIALAQFAYDLGISSDSTPPSGEFDPLSPKNTTPRLRKSFHKLVRMTRSVRVNQFASFME